MCNRTLASDRAVNILLGAAANHRLTSSSSTSTTMAPNHLLHKQQYQPQHQHQHHPLEIEVDLAEILDRDQRTTCHRTTGNGNLMSSGGGAGGSLSSLNSSSLSSSSLNSSSSNSSSVVVLDCCGLRTKSNHCCISGVSNINLNSNSSNNPSASAGDNRRNNLILNNNSGDVCSISTVSSCKLVEGTGSSSSSDPESGLRPVRSSSGQDTADSQLGNAGFRRTRWERSVVTWLRLGGLLLALLTVSVQSAPAVPTAAMMMALQDKRWASQPKWTNPCGFEPEDFADSNVEVMQLSDEMLLGNILTQAKTALNYAVSYREDFVKRVFNTEYMDHHLQWKDNRYDWLPSLEKIPKELGEPLDKQYLEKLHVYMLNGLLQDSYEFMQTFAAGLEQVTWDQEDFHRGFHKEFQDTEYMLRTVLCEIQVAQVERSVSPRADIGREVMPSAYRNMSDNTGFRDLRDWLIFRDYMNGLEYVIQVFEYLKRLIES